MRRIVFSIFLFYCFLFAHFVAPARAQETYLNQYIVRADGFWCPASARFATICPASGYPPGLHLVTLDAVKGLSLLSDMVDAETGELDSDLCSEIAPGLPCSPNFKVNLTQNIPNDALWSQLWGLANINAPAAWEETQGSDELIAAVIDTGINYAHPELAGMIHPKSKSAIDNSRGDDDNGHGSHVAGTILAQSNNRHGIAGVAWRGKILSLKFLQANGGGSLFHAIRAIDYVTELKKSGENIVVINASWGGTGFSSPLRESIRDALDAGISFVAAAGNSAKNTDVTRHYPSGYNLTNIISVGSIDSLNRLSPFSNYGAGTVDMTAPGSQILSLSHQGSAYARLNGTSMSTPHVAGAILLLKAKYPDLSVTEVREKLLKSVRQLPNLINKVASNGTLDVQAALKPESDNGNQEPVCKKKKARECQEGCKSQYRPRTRKRQICKRCCLLTHNCIKELKVSK